MGHLTCETFFFGCRRCRTVVSRRYLTLSKPNPSRTQSHSISFINLGNRRPITSIRLFLDGRTKTMAKLTQAIRVSERTKEPSLRSRFCFAREACHVIRDTRALISRTGACRQTGSWQQRCGNLRTLLSSHLFLPGPQFLRFYGSSYPPDPLIRDSRCVIHHPTFPDQPPHLTFFLSAPFLFFPPCPDPVRSKPDSPVVVVEGTARFSSSISLTMLIIQLRVPPEMNPRILPKVGVSG
jgi:hypothetical protein